ncbi:hypothetical protein [Microbacterium immunditiarum]|uniref:Uncharacterized protein n=1 Tax=Microbacterium immunditiarum TaxID=337480 RepID=A0A7Y9KJ79_9MICO|nr:hypothetical protein [Microbacterium immunditiarum]NYE21352.1 hypothetical protein [Microbacterium immunditiarum]
MSAYEAGATAGTDSKKEELKERAAEAAGEVDAGAKHVVGVAGDELGNVAHKAKTAARGFFDETRHQLTEQASHQQRRAAGSLRTTGDQLVGMAQSTESDNVATGIVRTVGQKTRDAASWLDQREPGDLVHEVRGFARRHTGAFLLIAVGVGVVAGRLTRALMSNGDGSSSSRTSARSTPAAGGGSAGHPMATGAAVGAMGPGSTGAASGVGTSEAGRAAAPSGAATAAGDTPIADALAAETGSGHGTDGRDGAQGLLTEGESAQDEWSRSGEVRR